MVRKYMVPILAVGGTVTVVYALLSQDEPRVRMQPSVETAREAYGQPVVGAGVVEASTQNIAIGTPVPGVVTSVFVNAGDEIKAGDPLFTIDDRAARAELETRRAALRVAEQTLSRLTDIPRAEDLPPAEAMVAEAEAQLRGAEAQVSIAEAAGEDNVAKIEVSKRRNAVHVARARLAQARAQLELLKAGAWKDDIEVAQAQAELARAKVKAAETDLARLTVRAPVDGEVFRVNIRPGEYAPAGAPAGPLMLMGDTRTLYVRVDVDEYDAWRVRPGSLARAVMRGNRELQTDLEFVRIEPYVVPKRSLTGEATERVDTRVLQVLFSFPRSKLPAYVGQQVDVFIYAPPTPESGEGN